MKSIFTKLSTLFLCGVFALVSCSDFSADLKQLNEELDALADKSATKTQVAELEEAIKELKAKLSEQYATIADVEAVITTIEGVQASLNDAKANLEAALDTKADKTTLQTAVSDLTDALTAAKTEIEGKLGDVDSSIESLGQKVADDLQALTEKVEEDLKAAKEALEGQIGDLENNLGDVEGDVENLQGTVGNIQTSLDKVIEDVDKLDETLSKHSEAFAEYKEEVTGKFEEVSEEITKVSESLSEQLEDLREEMSEKADAELVENVSGLQEALGGVNETLSTLASTVANKADKTDVAADIQKVEKALASDIAALEDVVKNWKDNDTKYDDTELRAAVAAATKEYKSLVADLQAQIDALENTIDGIHNELNGIKDELNGMKSELRSVVAVPQTMYNGTKAVKFHRIEGENVLKTYADVSFHFNPANFDASTASYEIVAEKVEFMTRAINNEPAIEIVGVPVQENGKVTFRLERAEGAGNMFALKATLADGSVIYSDYIAILDEATYAVATATASFPVERIAFELPKLNSITAIVDYVQSLGTVVEDFETSIEAISAAVKAVQENDLENVMANLVDIPGIKKVQTNITATASYKVQVETLDAEEIIELLQNAQTIDEIRAIINDLLGKANGLGEVGSTIVDGLNNAFGNSGLNNLLSQFENLESIELPSLILSYEQAEAKLNQYEQELAEAKANYESLKAQMDAIVGGLSAEKQAEIATLQAELDALNAEYETASALNKVIIWGKIEAKELEITAIAGGEYFVVKAKYDLAMGGVATAEYLLQGAKEGLKLADDAVKAAQEKLANLETEILNKIKNYIFENTELGQYIKELENALAEQGWEAKKAAAKGVAELGALDAVIAGLIQNYNAANEAVVAEFANSLFGRFAYLIQTEEAAQAFEAISLTEVYVALKQIPEVIEFVIKYYPSGADFSSFENWNDITSILSGYIANLIPEMNVEWEIDYLLATAE